MLLRRTAHLAVAFVLLILSGLAAAGQEFVRGPGGPERRSRIAWRGNSTASLTVARTRESVAGRLSGLPAVATSLWPTLTPVSGASLPPLSDSPLRLERPPLPPRAPPLA